MAKPTCDYLLVAAIDIGTTFSGYAFSFRHEYEKDPTQVCANSWCAGSAGLMSHKTSTCILFNPQGEFDSFGYAAEDKYSDLVLDGEYHDWYYFRRFKMELYKENHLKRGLTLEADNGRTKPALDVISQSIRYLKDHLMQTSVNQQSDLEPSDILWVITVPAIWSDPAKQFMREAAEKADIPGNQIRIALEPEAASLFCMHIPVNKSDGGYFSAFEVGSKYIVLDAGGGTIDITVHEVQTEGALKELHKANGGDWGGTKVDEAFFEFFTDIFGKDVIDSFSKEHKSDMLDLYRDFEVKKRTITPASTDKFTFKVPSSLTATFESLYPGKAIRDGNTANVKYKGKLSWFGDKLRINADLAQELYSNPIQETVKHLQKLFSHCAVKNCCAIFMVGGFSESKMLQEAIKANFKNMRVIVPREAELSVLKGAVIFGHNPHTIKYRVCKYTYGVNSSQPFDPLIHRTDKKYTTSDGKVHCRGLFSKHVEIGQTVAVGEPQVNQSYGTDEPDRKEATFKVYISTEEDPFYVTDKSCKCIGGITIHLPDTVLGTEKRVTIFMTFSGTELEVKAINNLDGKSTAARFDLLE